MSTTTALRATDLGAQHLGQTGTVVYGTRWTITGRLNEITHRIDQVVETTLCNPAFSVPSIPGRQWVSMEVAGFRTGDLDVDLVQVELR